MGTRNRVVGSATLLAATLAIAHCFNSNNGSSPGKPTCSGLDEKLCAAPGGREACGIAVTNAGGATCQCVCAVSTQSCDNQVCVSAGSLSLCEPCTLDVSCASRKCDPVSKTCTQDCATSCPAPAVCQSAMGSGYGHCVCSPDAGLPDAAADAPADAGIDADAGLARPDADAAPATRTILPGATGDVSTLVYPLPANAGGGFGWNLQAQFTTLTSGGYTQTVTQYGNCDFAVFSGGPAVTSNVSAGTLTSMHGTTTDTATPGAMNSYYQSGPSGPTPHFNPGDMVTLAWTGGTVGAGMATLVAPTSLSVTQPLVPDAGIIVVDRRVPFQFAFTGMSPGTIDVSIFGSDGLSSTVCHYDGTQPGTFMIPVAALSGLGAGSGGSFFVSQSSATTVKVGTLDVNVSVGADPIGSDGQVFATMLATIQ